MFNLIIKRGSFSGVFERCFTGQYAVLISVMNTKAFYQTCFFTIFDIIVITYHVDYYVRNCLDKTKFIYSCCFHRQFVRALLVELFIQGDYENGFYSIE